MALNPLLSLKELGQSIWLDDIRRIWLEDGTFARLVAQDGVQGVTSNPAIFEKAITHHHDYDAAIGELARQGLSGVALYETIVVEDIRHAADLLRSVYERSRMRDGYVSLEVSPHLAHDTDATIAEAQRLWTRVARPNLMIKVPATKAGLPAIQKLIALGINVNVTLLFSVARYRAVADAYIAGLEDRLRAGHSLAGIASVASFFLSRIDTLIDATLDKLKPIQELRGAAAIACARLAYQEYRQLIATPRWQALIDTAAQPQRLLWASTSTKDKSCSDVKYVENLVGPNTVNTLPFETLAAYRDHGQPAVRIEDDLGAMYALPARLAELGIDLDEVSQRLEDEGVRKFIEPYDKLIASLSTR